MLCCRRVAVVCADKEHPSVVLACSYSSTRQAGLIWLISWNKLCMHDDYSGMRHGKRASKCRRPVHQRIKHRLQCTEHRFRRSSKASLISTPKCQRSRLVTTVEAPNTGSGGLISNPSFDGLADLCCTLGSSWQRSRSGQVHALSYCFVTQSQGPVPAAASSQHLASRHG